MDEREVFAQHLGRVSRGWRARLDQRLRATGQTQARWSALLHLSRSGGGMTQRELADRLGIEGATIGRILDALEKQGLVERRPVEGDRRAYHIHLTAAAQPLLKEINRIAASLRRELLAGITAQDLRACIAVLRRVGERLEKRADD
jgi:MarR family transcriptional regulator, transcriptional regulator for hemolysin